MVANEIQRQYSTEVLGSAAGVVERFYAITAQRRMKHPLLELILERAQQGLFVIDDKHGASKKSESKEDW